MIALPVFLVMQIAAFAADMTADDIIAKNLEARGGKDKVLAIKTAKLTAKVMNHGTEMPGTLEWKRPNLLLMEFQVQGQDVKQGYDGQTAWYIMPLMGTKDPQKMSEDDAKDIIEQADFDGPLVNYKEKGNTVELVGSEDVEGTPAYKLKLTLKSGDVRYIFIDKDSFLELKATAMMKREGNEMQIDSLSGDYKEVNGLMMPFSIETRVKDQVMSQITIDKIELDVPIDDAIFKMPPATQSAPSK